jgi:hypothetical protein
VARTPLTCNLKSKRLGTPSCAFPWPRMEATPALPHAGQRTNSMHLVLFGSQNWTLRPYLLSRLLWLRAAICSASKCLTARLSAMPSALSLLLLLSPPANVSPRVCLACQVQCGGGIYKPPCHVTSFVLQPSHWNTSLRRSLASRENVQCTGFPSRSP